MGRKSSIRQARRMRTGDCGERIKELEGQLTAANSEVERLRRQNEGLAAIQRIRAEKGQIIIISSDAIPSGKIMEIGYGAPLYTQQQYDEARRESFMGGYRTLERINRFASLIGKVLAIAHDNASASALTRKLEDLAKIATGTTDLNELIGELSGRFHAFLLTGDKHLPPDIMAILRNRFESDIKEVQRGILALINGDGGTLLRCTDMQSIISEEFAAGVIRRGNRGMSAPRQLLAREIMDAARHKITRWKAAQSIFKKYQYKPEGTIERYAADLIKGYILDQNRKGCEDYINALLREYKGN